ncbi:polysaccharide biosynthesis C-terminal domain-containing protein [Corallincola spongiicola]|uniref:Polysaccharide biosynthesis protein C-terminal domain-containing protein n=1 Tax=Corallincola spongiicola TaxID=2520508 RepID=A0ABY1WSN6_9GAMM|nr:polysaccharide biosynthesis C-terminal domain-containing protein [Corallincola spongiicola]TAA47750.1 hypothetical protein EXY25_00425 [Corallincola spongiicola]
MTEKNMFRSLMGGAAFRTISLFLNVAVAFFMMPYLIQNLGDYWYGIWVIVATVIGYYGMLDMGLSSACQRFLSKAYATGSRTEINSYLSTGFFSFILVSFLFFIVTLALSGMSDLFFDEVDDASVFSLLMLLLGAKLLITMPYNCYVGVINAHFRYDIVSKIELVKTLARAFGFYFLLDSGYGIISIAVCTTVIEVIGAFLLFFGAKSLDPDNSVSFRFYSTKCLKEFFDFGKHSFVINIANLFRFQLDSLVIAGMISVSMVTHFGVASRLIQYKGQLFDSIMGIFMPVFTKMHSLGRTEHLASRLRLVLGISSFLAFLLCSLPIVFGKSFILLWMGEDYLDAYYPLAALSASSMFALCTYPLLPYLNALAQHKKYAYITLAESVLNIALSILLAPSLGILGVALGTAISVLISKSLFIVPYAFRLSNMSLRSFYIPFFYRLLVSFVYFCSVFLICNFYCEIDSYLELVIYVFFSSAIYCFIYFYFLAELELRKYLFDKFPVRFHGVLKLLWRL